MEGLGLRGGGGGGVDPLRTEAKQNYNELLHHLTLAHCIRLNYKYVFYL